MKNNKFNLLKDYEDELILVLKELAKSEYDFMLLVEEADKYIESIDPDNFQKTPITNQENLNVDIDAQTEKLIEEGCHGVVLFGSTGQAQLISSNEKKIRENKVKKMEMSKIIGETLAKRAAEKKITKVYFDRGSFKYHGRIKSLADGIRKKGIKF